MSLESATYIWQLVPTNPEGIDNVSQGDDHIRMVKLTLQNSFPGMTAPWETANPIGCGNPTLPQHAMTLGYFQALPFVDPIGRPFLHFLPDLPGPDYIDFEGQALDRTIYAELFALYGVRYGNGNGTTTFNVPDCRGYAFRVWDHGAGRDPNAATRTARADGTGGDNVGTTQLDEFKAHTHNMHYETVVSNGGVAVIRPVAGGSLWATDSTGGAETRMKNFGIRVICRAK